MDAGPYHYYHYNLISAYFQAKPGRMRLINPFESQLTEGISRCQMGASDL